MATFVFVFLGGEFLSSDQELEAKLLHSTTRTGFAGRMAQVVQVSSEDWALLEPLGHGIGYVGVSANAGGPDVRRQAQLMSAAHPILHFGWFSDLVTFGIVGYPLRLAAFFLLLVAVWPRRENYPSSRFAGLVGGCLLTVSLAVYFFVATSWLHGVSGGLLFGAAIGLCSGCRDRKSLTSTPASTREYQREAFHRRVRRKPVKPPSTRPRNAWQLDPK